MKRRRGGERGEWEEEEEEKYGSDVANVIEAETQMVPHRGIAMIQSRRLLKIANRSLVVSLMIEEKGKKG